MCGIVGYIGNEQAAPVLIDGLSRLEYRGYDSAGVAVFNGQRLEVVKSKGKLAVLSDMIHGGADIKGTVGIGHTRWATHGAPSDTNAHPHLSTSERFAVIHNGIIENYMELKNKLISRGVSFVSDTDTEVIAQMVEYYYNGDIFDTMVKVLNRVEGSYALGVIDRDNPDEIVAVRKDSPLIIGVAENGYFIASDVPAILNRTREVYYPDEKEIIFLHRDGVTIYNFDHEAVEKELVHIDWDADAAEKGGYEHFMIKEIMEQPKAIADTIESRIKDGRVRLDDIELTAQQISDIDKIYIVACGSAYHVGMVGKYVLERLVKKTVDVDLASEFRYRSPLVTDKTLVIVISQSGETADTRAAMAEAKKLGARTLAVVNVLGSSIAKAADDVIYTWAGPEIAVATTKAYSCQLAVLYLLGIYMAQETGLLSAEEEIEMLRELLSLPGKIQSILDKRDDIQYYASLHYNEKNIFFIGRNLDYAVSLEGSLKLKEISYIHSEAYAAGELKHGTISLIEDGTLVVAVATQDRLFDKTMSNVVEVISRGATTLGVSKETRSDIRNTCDFAFLVPETDDLFMPSLSVIPLQLFGYYVASMKGCDIDKPRNLAKSVTVE
ncbi:MAG: glutamine--fructose-6-phosphate transaminase (isomerizing) [Clostridia bacterium]|nr:glutamine--fructose-6-phosphate transaminase (isomerizing) [Clostridia bacterium]